MTEMKVFAGMNITEACQQLVECAPAWMEFNGVRVEAHGGETPYDLESAWRRDMNAAAEEYKRKQRKFEATPEGKLQLAEIKRKDKKEKQLQREAIVAIDASGLRKTYPWQPGMRELSGFGGGYEAACRTMMYAGLLWLNEHPNANARGADKDAFEKAIFNVEPECSGAMSGAAASHALFIKENGYKAWVERISVSS